MGRNLLLRLGEDEGFLEIKRLNVNERLTLQRLFAVEEGMPLIFASLFLLVSLYQDEIDVCLES